LQTALVYFGWLRQTANKKRQTLHRYRKRLPSFTKNFPCELFSVTRPTSESFLSKENFPVYHDLNTPGNLLKIYKVSSKLSDRVQLSFIWLTVLLFTKCSTFVYWVTFVMY